MSVSIKRLLSRDNLASIYPEAILAFARSHRGPLLPVDLSTDSVGSPPKSKEAHPWPPPT